MVELLITPLQFGIPNSRLRYYLLAKASPVGFTGVDGSKERVWRHIPGRGTDWTDPRGQAGEEVVDIPVTELRKYLDNEDIGASPHPHAIPERTLEKWGRLFDIVLPTAKRTCCFTRGKYVLLNTATSCFLNIFVGYTKLVERAGSVLQMNEELDVS